MPRCALIVTALALAGALACGGNGNPGNPSGSGGSSGGGSAGGGGTGTQTCFAIVGNKGTITATISGLAAFNGTIPNGQANRVTGGPVPTYTIGAINTQDGTGVIISGQAVVGTSAIGSGTVNTPAASNSVSVQTRSCTAGTGNWVASIASGSGTITVTSSSATGISGSFSATLEPTSGTGAAGTKTITGTFNATY
jgi:hypothetical protein